MQPLSLYVHVPFCGRGKCAYCDFYSVPTPGEEAVRAVISGTLREAGAWLERLGRPPVETVFVGGGTPSSLGPAELAALLQGIRRLAGDRIREWTVEANPESLTPRFLEICAEAGVDRISLGLQTLRDGLLAKLGRSGDSRRSLEALDRLRENWPGRLNADFLAGIPGQTEEDLLADLERVTGPGPGGKDGRPEVGSGAPSRIGHVSLYTLTPLEDSELAAAVNPEAQERTWLAGYAFLESRGYRNYEISNFARRGEECRHNLRYWRLEPYLGVGPAAVSTLPLGGRVVRLIHPESLEPYLRAAHPGEAAGEGGGWGAEAEEIDPLDFLFETLMMGLRLREGISAALFRRRFGRPLPQLLQPLWRRWQEEGLAAGDDARRYRLTRKGRWLLDGLLRQVRGHLEAHPPRDLAVRWP